ncbi:MAG: serine hydrolase domain-containing protein [Acidobacteriota bacterium]
MISILPSILTRVRPRLAAALGVALAALGCDQPPLIPPPPDTAPELEAMDLFQAVYPPITVGSDVPPVGAPLVERLDHYRVPSISIAVVDGGELRFAKTWSRLSVEEAPTPDSAFQAGSLSKLMAATVALRLARQRDLDLDRDLVSQFPQLRDSVEYPVTLRELLSHTGGFAPAAFAGYERGQELPTLDQILQGSGPANSAPVAQVERPGTLWRYSGGGYQLVEKTLELASGRSFNDLAREEIFEPLEMKNTSFLEPRAPEAAARGHLKDGSPVPEGWKVYPELAAAGLWTTPRDIASWIVDLQKAYAGKPARRLHKTTARGMVVAQDPGNWGIGPKLGGDGHSSWFAHAGAGEGYRAFVVGFISSGHGAVIMANGDGATPLIREVLAGLAEIYNWPTFQAEVREAAALETPALDSMAGTFELAEAAGHRAVLEVQDGELVLSLFGGESRLYARDGNSFFDLTEGWEVQVETRDGEDRALALEITVFPSMVFTARRVTL